MKKLSMFIISLLVFTQINTYALQNKESLNPFAEDDTIAKEDKDSDRTIKISENKPKKKAAFSMGIEGGYMWEMLDSNVAPSSLADKGLVYNLPNYAKVGLTFAISEMYPDEVGVAKHSASTAIGYIFIDNGWGTYFTIDYNRNFKLDKKGNSYFYLGVGSGLSYTTTSTNYNVNSDSGSANFDLGNKDLIWQAVRVPVGFKFLLSKSTELFFESAVYVGMSLSTIEFMNDVDNHNYNDLYNGTIGVETKGGLRFMF